jgi:hypothetical protein
MEMKFQAFPFTDELREQAKEWSQFESTNNSIRRDGENQIIGNAGEILFQRMFPYAKRINAGKPEEADFQIGTERIDVKVKQRNAWMRPDYVVTLEARQRRFAVDWYSFFSFNAKAEVFEFCGWMPKGIFFNRAKFWKRGQWNSNHTGRIKADRYDMEAKDLWTLDDYEKVQERIAIQVIDGGIQDHLAFANVIRQGIV